MRRATFTAAELDRALALVQRLKELREESAKLPISAMARWELSIAFSNTFKEFAALVDHADQRGPAP